MSDTATTVYAVCFGCLHVEPRPAHAVDDWAACESCGRGAPELAADLDAAEELVDCDGHPAPDCGPRYEHAAIGELVYCDGSCKRTR